MTDSRPVGERGGAPRNSRATQRCVFILAIHLSAFDPARNEEAGLLVDDPQARAKITEIYRAAPSFSTPHPYYSRFYTRFFPNPTVPPRIFVDFHFSPGQAPAVYSPEEKIMSLRPRHYFLDEYAIKYCFHNEPEASSVAKKKIFNK